MGAQTGNRCAMIYLRDNGFWIRTVQKAGELKLGRGTKTTKKDLLIQFANNYRVHEMLLVIAFIKCGGS